MKSITKLLFPTIATGLVINEVANKGSNGVCDGEDWIELYNPDTNPLNLEGYQLCDDKGCDDSKALTFESRTIEAQALLLLCKDTDFKFGIGSGDTVTLVDPTGEVLESVFLEGSGVEDVTFSRIPDVAGDFRRTGATAGAFNSPVVVSEIASKGSDGTCDGEDWIELHNTADFSVSLANHMLCDDKGCSDEDAFTFPSDASLGAFETKVLCKDQDFAFGIGKSDTIILMGPSNVELARIQLPGEHSTNISWSRVMEDGVWVYRAIAATPGEANVVDAPAPPSAPFSPPMSPPPAKISVTCDYIHDLHRERCCDSNVAELPDMYTSFAAPNRATTCEDLKMQMRRVDDGESCCKNRAKDLSTVDVRMDTVIHPKDEAAFLYEDASLHHFDIHLSPENMEILDSDPVAEKYVPGNVTFQGETYTNVGIRYKGSVGAWILCVEDSTPASALTLSGRRTCDKLSLKIAFDEYDDNQRFFGLRKILLHAMNNDGSYMRERIGYRLFREMGVPAPRANHATANINGRLGLYANVEYIDDIFTQTYFGDGGTGNLFKERWPSKGPYQPVSADYFRSGLRTNKGTASMTNVLNFVDSVAEDGKNLQTHVRMSHFARYVAVDRLIGHDDGSMHFRCFNTQKCETHNFYFYEESGQPLFWFIPWDLDLSFPTGIAKQLLTMYGDWKDLEFPCGPVSTGGQTAISQGLQLSASCDSIYRSMATYHMSDFEAAVDAVLRHPYYVGLSETIDAYLEQIRPTVDSIGYSDWNGGISRYTSIDDAIRDLKRVIMERKDLINQISSLPVQVYNSTCADPPVLQAGLTCEDAVTAVGCDYEVNDQGLKLKDICIATCGTCGA